MIATKAAQEEHRKMMQEMDGEQGDHGWPQTWPKGEHGGQMPSVTHWPAGGIQNTGVDSPRKRRTAFEYAFNISRIHLRVRHVRRLFNLFGRITMKLLLLEDDDCWRKALQRV